MLGLKIKQKRWRVAQNQHLRCFVQGFVFGPFPGRFGGAIWGRSWALNPSHKGCRSVLKNDTRKTSQKCARRAHHGPPDLSPEDPQIDPKPDPAPPQERPRNDVSLNALPDPSEPPRDPSSGFPGTPRDLLLGWILELGCLLPSIDFGPFRVPAGVDLGPSPVRTSIPNWSTI